jgi:aerobic-type carbon monoxide dehydrogenase small subunit (CoxS/CutS family)
MSRITLKVNGTAHIVDVEPLTPLLYVLRNDLGLQGPRFGCGLGQCGACAVIINGVATRSCVTPCSNVRSEITTLEGLASNGTLHPVQQAWIDEQVPQCGFCQNGQIITAKVLLDKTPNPTDAQIREGMAGALCRCMTYYRVQAAVKRAASRIAKAEGGKPGLPRRSADLSAGAQSAKAEGAKPGLPRRSADLSTGAQSAKAEGAKAGAA